MLNKKALELGVILGLIEIGISVLIYLMGMEVMANWWIWIAVGLALFGVKIFFSLRLKKVPLEEVTYWQAFFAIIILSAVAGALSFMYQKVIAMIDPDLTENLKNAMIQKTAAWMESMDAPQEKIDETIDSMAQGFEEQKVFSVGRMMISLLYVSAWYAAFGFIMAIFVKKKPPMFDPNLTPQS